MNINIEEIVKEFNKKFTYAGNGYYLDDTVDANTAFDWLRTKLTSLQSHHEEEVRKAVEEERERILIIATRIISDPVEFAELTIKSTPITNNQESHD